jgi:hypothetical protein
MEVSGQLHAPVASAQAKQAPRTHWIGGWVGPRAGLDFMEWQKPSCTYNESNPYSSVVLLHYCVGHKLFY